MRLFIFVYRFTSFAHLEYVHLTILLPISVLLMISVMIKSIYHTSCQFHRHWHTPMNWVMVTRWTVPQLFRPEDAASMFSKEKNYIWIHATTEQLCTLLQIILNDFCPREDDSVSCTASSLHDRALSVDCMVKCVHREWFLELFVSPRSDFHDTIISVFNAVLPEGPKVTGI